MGELWKAGKDIQDLMGQLIANNHPDLALVVDEMIVMFKEKAGNRGGQVVYGSISRSSAMVKALTGKEYKFIITLGSDKWENELSNRQREACLDHYLTACRATEDPKSGEVKCHTASPDLMAFRENVERYGLWWPVAIDENTPPIDPLAAALGIP